MKALAAHLHPHCPNIHLVLPPIAPGGTDIADVIKAKRNVDAWLNEHIQTHEPEKVGEGSPDLPPLQLSDGENEDKWSSLLAEGKNKPGVIFEPETLALLAALKDKNRPEWMNLRNRIKGACRSVPIRDLDKAIDQLLGSKEVNLQGQTLEWDEPEPWPETVEGAALLNEIATLIRRYVHMSDTTADALALWVVHTWLHDRLEISTFLNGNVCHQEVWENSLDGGSSHAGPSSPFCQRTNYFSGVVPNHRTPRANYFS